MNTDRIRYFKNKIFHQSAGGILFCSSNTNLKVALVKLIDGIWVIPKGHIKKRETPRQAALREIKEELRISKDKKLKFIGKIGTDNYKFKMLGEKRVQYKKVHLFLFTIDKEIILKPLKKEGFINTKWFSFPEALKKISSSNLINNKSRYLKINKIIKSKFISKKILLEARKLFQNFKNKENYKKAIYIRGGKKLKGEVKLSGSKHAVISIIISSLLTNKKVFLQNVPKIEDVFTLCKCLKILGAKILFKKNTLFIEAKNIKNVDLPFSLINKMRGTYLFLPVLLARKGYVNLPLPGGDRIGSRPPMDYISPLRKLGAQIKFDGETIKAGIKKFHSTKIILKKEKPRPAMTKEILIASVLGKGKTTIINPAKLPEIIYLIRFLNLLGAKIYIKKNKIVINRVKFLQGGNFKIPLDRIELISFISVAGVTKSKIIIKNVKSILASIKAEMNKFREAGIRFSSRGNDLIVFGNQKLRGIKIQTGPYPGFNTDSQPLFAPLLIGTIGKNVIKEGIFKKRFDYAKELIKMGANIKIKNESIVIKNSPQLKGAKVKIKDIRGAAACVISALGAKGITVIKNPCWLDRGYENFDKKLSKLGAEIWRK